MKKTQIIKGWAVLLNRRIFTPVEYLGAHTIFRNKEQAVYWAETRVNKSIKRRVVPIEIKYRVKEIQVLPHKP